MEELAGLAQLVATLLSVSLASAGLLYVLWAAGSNFPFANEQALARSIIGRRGITRVPSRATFLYLAVLLLAAALAAFMMGGFSEQVPQSKPFLAPVGALLAATFIGRGIAGILPAFERSAPEQPYLSLNRRFYSPLCGLAGIGFAFLTLALPNWGWRLSQLSGG
ncbi:MAG TPA: hypothetical protein DCY26_11605 [Hyphomonas sp.]|nr:hypothetical protein [Hyphomonas sp.]